MSTPITAITLDQKKLAELQESGPKTLAQANELTVIENADDYSASSSLLDRVHERQQYWTNFFEKPSRDAFGLHKWITGMRSTLLAPYVRAEAILKDARAKYRAEEERKRQLKEEEERQAAKLQMEQDALVEAAKMQEIGESEAAEIIITRAATAPPPPVIVPSTIPKEAGKSVRKVYKFRVTNPALHKREFLVLDESKVKAVVSQLGPDAVGIVGGIEVYQEEIETVRSRKQ